MKKHFLLKLCAAVLLVGGAYGLSADTTYIKNPDGSVQSTTILNRDAAADLAGDLSGRLSQIDQKIRFTQESLATLIAQRATVQAELNSLIAAQTVPEEPVVENPIP